MAVLFALGAGVSGLAQSLAPPPFEDSMAQRLLACTGCHGAQGRAAADGYHPRLAGKPEGYLYQQLLNFRDGRRQYGLMKDLLAPLSDDYLRDIARHFSQLDLPYPPPQPSPLSPQDLAPAEALVRQGDPARKLPACQHCHGARLTGRLPAVPGLLGLPRDYLTAQLAAFRQGQRRAQAPDCMTAVAHKLQPAEIQQLAHWLASQPLPQQHKPDALGPGSPSLPDCGLSP